MKLKDLAIVKSYGQYSTLREGEKAEHAMTLCFYTTSNGKVRNFAGWVFEEGMTMTQLADQLRKAADFIQCHEEK